MLLVKGDLQEVDDSKRRNVRHTIDPWYQELTAHQINADEQLM
jgi:hypothetical protein